MKRGKEREKEKKRKGVSKEINSYFIWLNLLVIASTVGWAVSLTARRGGGVAGELLPPSSVYIPNIRPGLINYICNAYYHLAFLNRGNFPILRFHPKKL